MPGFARVLTALADAYHNKPDDIRSNVDRLRRAIASMGETTSGGAIRSGLAERRGGGSRAALRQHQRRDRRRAQVSEYLRLCALSARLCRDRQSELRRDGPAYPDQDGQGRDLRSDRRRVPSLQRGRALAGAALREDALRQRAAGAALSRRRSRLGRTRLPECRARDARLRACAR